VFVLVGPMIVRRTSEVEQGLLSLRHLSTTDANTYTYILFVKDIQAGRTYSHNYNNTLRWHQIIRTTLRPCPGSTSVTSSCSLTPQLFPCNTRLCPTIMLFSASPMATHFSKSRAYRPGAARSKKGQVWSIFHESVMSPLEH